MHGARSLVRAFTRGRGVSCADGLVMEGCALPQIISLYDVAARRRAWKDTPILYAHPESGDRVRVFLLGEEEALVAFIEAEDLEVTDRRALDPNYWRDAVKGPCSTYIGISTPKAKRGRKPKNRKRRNANRQKYGRIEGVYLRHVCLGHCRETGRHCREVSLGHGVMGCACQ